VNAAVLGGLIGAGSSVVAAVVALSAFLYTRNSGRREARRITNSKALSEAIAAGIAPVGEQVAILRHEVSLLSARVETLSSSDVHVSGQVTEILSKVAVLDTKMEVFWKNVALDAARILHSPHPERAHVDALLEALMDGTITAKGREDLRQVLRYMRDYHPGDPSEFPIYPGEQVAAVILLRSMEYA
jgi:hypothetical protein